MVLRVGSAKQLARGHPGALWVRGAVEVGTVGNKIGFPMVARGRSTSTVLDL